jgi:hypothetical protein
VSASEQRCGECTLAPASAPETLHVRFAAHYVTVASASPPVTSLFRESFAAMLDARPAGTCVGVVEVIERTGSLHVVERGAPELGPPPRGPAQAENRLFHATVKRLMAARSDLLWLHAGVAARDGAAVVLCARSGHGKSTLVAELLARGWSYYSDEIAAVDAATGTVIPFPIAPYKRVGDGRVLAEMADVQRLDKIPVEVGRDAIARAPARIGCVYFLSYRPAMLSSTLLSCSPAAAVLETLDHSLGDTTHREIEIRRLCGLMSRLPGVRLDYADPQDAVRVIEERSGTRAPVRTAEQAAAAASY